MANAKPGFVGVPSHGAGRLAGIAAARIAIAAKAAVVTANAWVACSTPVGVRLR